MTSQKAWTLVKLHESNGKLDAIGDNGRAGGAGQMWWSFRKDNWPAWGWNVLEMLDGLAFVACLAKHSPITSLREFYETVYNPGSKAPDLPAEDVEF